MLPVEVAQAAIQHALAEYPREACGLVLNNATYVPMKNVHEHPKNNFRMSMDDFKTHYLSGNVTALIHSHTGPDNPYPSQQDMIAQQSMGLPWGIIHISAERDIDGPFFFGDSLPIAPLAGRAFRPNVHDCYTLLRDVYRQEYNVTLPIFPREAEWWRNKQDMLSQNFTKAGFVQVDESQLQKNDVMLCRVNSPRDNPVANHIIIVRDNGLVLHHLSNRLSRHDPYIQWRSTTVSYVRYKG